MRSGVTQVRRCWVAVAVLVCAAFVLLRLAGAVAVTPIGSLVPSPSGEALSHSVVMGGYVFAAAPNAALGVQDQGAVFVYAEPAGGWSGTVPVVAVLTASAARPGQELGTSVVRMGGDVVVGDADGALHVFAPPAGGWRGEVHEIAVLTASDGSGLWGSPAVDGQTLVVQATNSAGEITGDLYVFSEPASGWSGSVREDAKLTSGMPQVGLGLSVAVSGSTIVAGAPYATVDGKYVGAVFVFSEPPGGWSGTLRPTAELTGSDVASPAPFITAGFGSSVGVSGSTIVTSVPRGGANAGAVYVFTEPPGGWVSETQAAKLVPSDGVISAGDAAAGSTPAAGTGRTPEVAVSGDTIIVPGSRGSNYVHPVEYVFQRPTAGWSGTLHESATLAASDGQPLGTPVFSGPNVVAGQILDVSGRTLVATGPAYVFAEPAGGWSGTINETAYLDGPFGTASGGEELYSEPSAGWSSEPPTATLLPPDDPQPVDLTNVAVSGATAVADGQGQAFVFRRPAGGWSTVTPSGTLSDPGALLHGLAISGTTVAGLAAPGARYPDGALNREIDVFEQPPGGWAGTVTPAAHLVPSDAASLWAVSPDTGTIFSLGEADNATWLYVFSEPADGWSGTAHETARLRLPTDSYSISVQGDTIVVNGTIDGRTIAAAQQAYVYSKPPGGWSEISAPSAILNPGYDDSAIDVYQQPVRGWVGTVPPTGRLLLAPSDVESGALAVSGDLIAVAVSYPPGKYDSCPCGGGFWVFSRPKHGWSGVSSAPMFTTATTDSLGRTGVALDGPLLFAAGVPLPHTPNEADLKLFPLAGTVSEQSLPTGRPTVHATKLLGIPNGKPSLTFTLTSGSNAPPIKSVTITLPHGLALNAHRLATGVHLAGAPPVNLSARQNTLTITARRPFSRMRVTLRYHALTESSTLLRTVRAQLKQKRRHPAKIAFPMRLALTDAFQQQTRIRTITTALLKRR